LFHFFNGNANFKGLTSDIVNESAIAPTMDAGTKLFGVSLLTFEVSWTFCSARALISASTMSRILPNLGTATLPLDKFWRLQQLTLQGVDSFNGY
jgi:hypothetical protein